MTAPTEHSDAPMYHDDDSLAGLTGRRRQQLMVLNRAFLGPFDTQQAASVLDIDVSRARRLLTSLAASGWLARIRKGWYIGVPIEASEPREWREDPWIVAATLFSPSYIGGWSAVEHWGLSDQIFNVVYVVAGRKIAPRRQTIQGTQFLIRTVPKNALFGTRRVWRQNFAIDVSDPHRTVIDILDVPASAGGVLHASEILEAYFESEYADPTKLTQYGDMLGRGTVFKRLGYLTERSNLADDEFVEACRKRITKGLSQLDPKGPPSGRIVSRWKLRINAQRLEPGKEDVS